MLHRVSVLFVFLFALSLVLGVAQAQPNASGEAEPPKVSEKSVTSGTSGTSETNKPPSGLWGETLQGGNDSNDKGMKKATGSAYNYTHIALSCVIFVIAGAGLVLLVRRQTRT